MLALVASILKPIKLSAQKVPTFLLLCDRRSVALTSCARLHGVYNNVGLAQQRLQRIKVRNAVSEYIDSLVNRQRCCWELLCSLGYTTQQSPATPEPVGPTMLGLVSLRLHGPWTWSMVSTTPPLVTVNNNLPLTNTTPLYSQNMSKRNKESSSSFWHDNAISPNDFKMYFILPAREKVFGDCKIRSITSHLRHWQVGKKMTFRYRPR